MKAAQCLYPQAGSPRLKPRQHLTHLRLALIDVVLEDKDGIPGTRQSRGVSPSTRMVVVSAYPDRGIRKQALKDLDTASLRQVIEDTLR